jgi:hypothetical protein
MLDRYVIPVSPAELDETIEAIRGLEPEEIGKQLQPVPGYASVPLPFAYENFAPIIAATIISHDSNLHEAPRDGTAFYSSRGELKPEIYDRLIADEDAAIEAAKGAGGLELYVAGNPDDRKNHDKPKAVIPFDFTPTNVSVCGWESLNQAKEGAATTQHILGQERASEYYNKFGIIKFDYHMKRRDTGLVVVYKGREARQNGKVVATAA